MKIQDYRGACVVLLALIPLAVSKEHLGWARWQGAVWVLVFIAVGALIAQNLIQSKEDHQREGREKERDDREKARDETVAILVRAVERLSRR